MAGFGGNGVSSSLLSSVGQCRSIGSGDFNFGWGWKLEVGLDCPVVLALVGSGCGERSG